MSGHPMLNTVILGISSGLLTVSALSGFISYGKVGNDPQLAGTKRMLLVASLLSLISALLLGLQIFLVRRHAKKMEHAYQGAFSITLLAVSGLLMMISGIMYAVAAAKINEKHRATYGVSHGAATLSSVLNLGGLVVVGVLFVTALVTSRRKVPVTVGPPVISTKVDLKPPYQEADGAFKQLQQLQVGERAISAAVSNPQGIGLQ